MKKCGLIFIGFLLFCGLVGFDADQFTIDNFDSYQKEFKTENMEVCNSSSTKTYMPYTAITNKRSKQYQFIQDHMTVDETTGMLYDEDGFIGAALGYTFGEIGSRYYFTLDTGIVLPIVKIDAKAAVHAPDGCSASHDASVIEFVIDADIAADYFGRGGQGLVGTGNFNKFEQFNGKIEKVEKVLDEKIEEGVTYDSELVDEESEKHEPEELDYINIEGGF